VSGPRLPYLEDKVSRVPNLIYLRNKRVRKRGLLVLLRTGVQSMQSIIFTAHVLKYCYSDPYDQEVVHCVLIIWFVHPSGTSGPDEVTGMWKLCPERDENGECPIQVILHAHTFCHVIVRGSFQRVEIQRCT
jgi:hypothetical protein